jgi:hypothetical protein
MTTMAPPPSSPAGRCGVCSVVRVTVGQAPTEKGHTRETGFDITGT